MRDIFPEFIRLPPSAAPFWEHSTSVTAWNDGQGGLRAWLPRRFTSNEPYWPPYMKLMRPPLLRNPARPRLSKLGRRFQIASNHTPSIGSFSDDFTTKMLQSRRSLEIPLPFSTLDRKAPAVEGPFTTSLVRGRPKGSAPRRPSTIGESGLAKEAVGPVATKLAKW